MLKPVIKAALPADWYGTLSTLRSHPEYFGRWIVPNTRAWTRTYFWAATHLYRREHLERCTRMRDLPEPRYWIDPDRGYAIADWSDDPEFRACLSYAQDLSKSVDWDQLAKRSKKPFLVTQPIDLMRPEHAAIGRFATSPQLLSIISHYIGSIPTLASCALWYSPNLHNEAGRSQEYHLDGEEMRQVKVFMPLEIVDSETGPLTFVPARTSLNVHRTLAGQNHDYRNRNKRVSDTLMAETAGDELEILEVVGEPGTLGAVDTYNCYHFGSRKAERPRFMLHLQYLSAFDRDLPLWNRKSRPLPEHLNDESGPIRALVLGGQHQAINVRRDKDRHI